MALVTESAPGLRTRRSMYRDNPALAAKDACDTLELIALEALHLKRHVMPGDVEAALAAVKEIARLTSMFWLDIPDEYEDDED